jgi:putative transposase
LTLTVMDWRYIFDTYQRRKILINALLYCIENKGLKVFSFVIMLNHLHLIIQSSDVAGFIRDFKKQTSFELMKNLKIHNPEIAVKFEDGKGKYCIWKKTNFPKLIETDPYFRQKKEYIEKNPVRKGYVERPEQWRYSSAFPTCGIPISVI